MEAIVKGGVALDGFICPGHVSTVTGSKIFDFIAEQYNLPCVVTGFEPVDILMALGMLIEQIEKAAPKVEIQYNRAVTRDGNTLAQKYMDEVFDPVDDEWRGLGFLPGSGLRLQEKYAAYDIEKIFPLEMTPSEQNHECICGDILRGLLTPLDCTLFAGVCNPKNPAGACMVSSEGACQIYYRFKRDD